MIPLPQTIATRTLLKFAGATVVGIFGMLGAAITAIWAVLQYHNDGVLDVKKTQVEAEIKLAKLVSQSDFAEKVQPASQAELIEKLKQDTKQANVREFSTGTSVTPMTQVVHYEMIKEELENSKSPIEVGNLLKELQKTTGGWFEKLDIGHYYITSLKAPPSNGVSKISSHELVLSGSTIYEDTSAIRRIVVTQRSKGEDGMEKIIAIFPAFRCEDPSKPIPSYHTLTGILVYEILRPINDLQLNEVLNIPH